MGLNRVNGSPVHDHRVRISANVQPPRKDTISHCQEEPIEAWIQVPYQPVRYWFHLPAAYRREGKAHRSATVANGYPARDQVPSKLTGDVIGVDGVLERERKIIGHAKNVSSS